MEIDQTHVRLRQVYAELEETHARLRQAYDELEETHVRLLAALAAPEHSTGAMTYEQRGFIGQMLFRRNGKPRKPLRLLLFSSSGKPRALTRNFVVSKSNGKPRRRFRQWMMSDSYLRLPGAYHSQT